MSPPKTRNGGPAQPAEAPANHAIAAPSQKQDHGQDSHTVRVPARFYGPSARRSLGVLVVTSCPFCPSGGPHLHRGVGGPRRAGCGGGDYILVPVPAVIERKGAA